MRLDEKTALFSAKAPQQGTYTLSGKLTEYLFSGAVPNASIVSGPYSVTSDADGNYSIKLPPGACTVTISRKG